MKLSLKRETLHGLSNHGLSSIQGGTDIINTICPDPIEIIPGPLTNLETLFTLTRSLVGPGCSFINGCI